MDEKKSEIVPDVKKDLCSRIKIRTENEIAPVDELLSAWFKRKVRELQSEEE